MEQELIKKQNNKVTIFAIILSFISIGLLIFGFFLVSSDKVVMLQSISNLSSKFEKLFDDNELFDKLATSKDLGIKTNLALTSDYANASLVVDYLENKEDKKSKLNLDLSVNEEKLLSVDGVLANNNVYLYAKDITPTYYYTALEYVSVLSSLKGNDYDKIMSLLKDTVKDSIDDDDIKKDKVEITYNGKTKKVNKLSYAITNKLVSDIITNYINALEKDKHLLENIAGYIGKTTDEVKNELDNFKKELTYDKVEIGCYYNVYYYGFNKIVKYELVDVDNKPILSYQIDGKEKIDFYANEVNIISLEVTNNKTQYDFSGFIINTEENNEKIEFNGNVKGDTLTLMLVKDEVTVKLVITSTIDIKESNYIYKTKIDLSIISSDEEVSIGTLDINIEYYFNEKVDVDLSNSVDISLITEEDITNIYSNLFNHPLYQLIAGMMEL